MDKDLNTLENEVIAESKIPLGYSEIKMSTKGLLGSPKSFHVRNARTEETLSLALLEEEQVPFKLPEFFNNLIYEEDVFIEEFTPKEVREFLLKFLQTFYTDTIEDMYEPMDDETWEQLEKYMLPTHYEQTRKNIEAGDFIPKFSLDLRTIQYYDIDEASFKSRIRIKNDKNKLNCVFDIPRFGDINVAKQILDKMFKEEDKRYEKNLEVLKMRQQLKSKIEETKKFEDLIYLPNIPNQQKEEAQEYAKRKAQTSLNLLRAIRLVEWNGEDTRDWKIDQKMEAIKDSRLSFSICKAIDEKFENLEYSFNPEVKVKYRFCNQWIKRRLSFRLSGFFEIISSLKDTESVIEFD